MQKLVLINPSVDSTLQIGERRQIIKTDVEAGGIYVYMYMYPSIIDLLCPLYGVLSTLVFHLVISYLFSSCKIWNEIDFQKHASWSFCRQVKEGVYTATKKKDKIKYKSISFECFLTVSNKICLFFCNYANKTHKDASNQLISTKTVACLIENCRPHLPK